MNKLNSLLAALGGSLQSIVLLFIRLAWGFQLAESGYGHLTHVAKTRAFFESLKFFGRYPMPVPALNVYVSGTTELVGGALLMLGFLSRPVAVLVFFNFCVAYATAGWTEVAALAHFQSPDDFINDAAFPFLVTALLVLAFGPGKVSIDAALGNNSTSG
jgi:putative oxidoreductase